MENVRKHRNIKLVTNKVRNNFLLLERNYHTTQNFSNNLLAIEMQKTLILMNKPPHLGLSILEMSEIVMHVLLYDYVKPNYGEKTKLCYMDTSSFMVYIKTVNSYIDIAKDAETRFDTSN